MKSDLCDISGQIQRETDKAYLFFDGVRTVWLPKSQVEPDPPFEGTPWRGTVAMPEWLAKEKELI